MIFFSLYVLHVKLISFLLLHAIDVAVAYRSIFRIIGSSDAQEFETWLGDGTVIIFHRINVARRPSAATNMVHFKLKTSLHFA